MADSRGEPPAAKRLCLGHCGPARSAHTKPGHGRFHKPDSLLDISAKKVAEKWPFEQVRSDK